MPRFPSKLIERFKVAEGTMAFGFERPAGFEFTAGQFLTLTLPDPLYTDEKSNRRVFSIASPPAEAGLLLIATRMTGSALKRSLADAPLGSPVSVFGPSGRFTLHADEAVPAVFIAGGIGITPFRSMLLDAVLRGLPHRITLISSNRSVEGAAFHEELTGLMKDRPQLRYVPTMTQVEDPAPFKADASRQRWNGERRLVSADMLRDQVGDVTRPIFYLAGPPGMVTAVTTAVLEAGADPSHVRSEEFEGY